jgi:hypothetical protein
MLFVGQGGAFSSSAARDEEVDARGYLSLDECAQSGFVERTVVVEWSDKRGACAGKHDDSPSLLNVVMQSQKQETKSKARI